MTHSRRVQTLRRPEPVTNVPVGVAVLLMRRNLALLIDEAAPADIRERLRQAVAAEPWVAEVAAVYIAVEITPVQRAP
jgi:divalent metal cation (Fe/Co/Zn/Cd) transporter